LNEIKKGHNKNDPDMYIPCGKNIYAYDINSLYPFVMKSFVITTGNSLYPFVIKHFDMSVGNLI
jgi:hypothetical protein